MGHTNGPIQGQAELLRAVRLIWQCADRRPVNPAAGGRKEGTRFKNICHGGQFKAASPSLHERDGRIQLHLAGMKLERILKMSARVSLATASGFSSAPRPPSRGRRGSSVPPPVSVIDQVQLLRRDQCTNFTFHEGIKGLMIEEHVFHLLTSVGVPGAAGRNCRHL